MSETDRHGLDLAATDAPLKDGDDTDDTSSVVVVRRGGTKKKAGPARKPRVVRKPPEGAVIPEQGWPGLVYLLQCMRGRPDLVPQVSSKEAAANAERARRAAQESIDACRTMWVRDASNSHGATIGNMRREWRALGAVVGVFSEKGGACKSTVSHGIAGVLRLITGADVLVIPIAANDGSTADKGGVEQLDTLSLPEAYKLLLALTKGTGEANAQEFKSHLKRNDFDVYVMAQVALPSDFGGERVRWVLEHLKKMFQFIILDTGNDIARDGGAAEGLPEGGNVILQAGVTADVLCFTCNVAVPDSPRLMGSSMDSMTVLGDVAKLARSAVVVNGCHDASPESLRKWVVVAENKIGIDGKPSGKRAFEYRVVDHGEGVDATGALVFVPWDEHLATSLSVDVRQFEPDTYRAFLRLVYELLVRAGAQQGRDFNDLARILEAKELGRDHDPFGSTDQEQLNNQLALLASEL